MHIKKVFKFYIVQQKCLYKQYVFSFQVFQIFNFRFKNFQSRKKFNLPNVSTNDQVHFDICFKHNLNTLAVLFHEQSLCQFVTLK